MFKVTRQQVRNTIVVFIWDLPEEKSPYLIHNKSKAFRLKYYQVNCPGDATTLYDDEKVTFVWSDFRHP
jgi:hypothetical protein